MSTLNVGNIQSTTAIPPLVKNNGGTEMGVFCRAYVFFNESASTFGSSLNVSSVSDDGSSQYTINFTSAFPDNDYMPLVQCSNNDDGRCAISNEVYNTTSACKMYTRGGFTSGRSDANNNMVTIWDK